MCFAPNCVAGGKNCHQPRKTLMRSNHCACNASVLPASWDLRHNLQERQCMAWKVKLMMLPTLSVTGMRGQVSAEDTNGRRAGRRLGLIHTLAAHMAWVLLGVLCLVMPVYVAAGLPPQPQQATLGIRSTAAGAAAMTTRDYSSERQRQGHTWPQTNQPSRAHLLLQAAWSVDRRLRLWSSRVVHRTSFSAAA